MNKILPIAVVCLLLSAAAVVLIHDDSDTSDTGNTVVDMEGTTVELPDRIDRVACISPSATDLMIAFGLGDKIVGTYKSFTYNPWASVLYIGASDLKAYSYSTSAEQYVTDGIDLVILQNTENAESIRNAGIPVIAVHQFSPDGPFDDEVYDVAEILSTVFPECKEIADRWIKDVRDSIALIQESVTVRGDHNVYYVNGEKAKGLRYSDGGNSMISRILNVSGNNLATEMYPVLNVHSVSDEEMLALNPYSIIIGGVYQNDLLDALHSTPGWSDLTAVTEGRVYTIPVAMVGIENVSAETPVMLKYVASLYNDSFEFDMHSELRENISTYFGYDLTDGDIDNMCMGLSIDGERYGSR